MTRLILTHVRPDGDTVGCAAALCAGLRRLGKTAYLLPNPELTDTTAPYFRPYEAPEGFTPDKVVSTDIATVGLFPGERQTIRGTVDLAIDHHPSFESFGRENIVRPEAAACGELIYDILSDLAPSRRRWPFRCMWPSPRTQAALPTPIPLPRPMRWRPRCCGPHRLSDRQQGVLPHQEPEADAAGGGHFERVRVL